MTDLRPCPWCGSDAMVGESHIEGWSVVVCTHCLATRPHGDKPTGAEAAAVWNRRATGWVPVDDGLPPEEQRVLVWWRDRYEARGGHRFSAIRRGMMWSIDGEGAVAPDEVSHWMPLSDPAP